MYVRVERSNAQEWNRIAQMTLVTHRALRQQIQLAPVLSFAQPLLLVAVVV